MRLVFFLEGTEEVITKDGTVVPRAGEKIEISAQKPTYVVTHIIHHLVIDHWVEIRIKHISS